MIALALLLLAPQDHASAFPGGDDAPPPAPRGCSRSGASDEITVCARDQSAFRVKPLTDRYREKPTRAELGLRGGGSVRAEAVQRGVGGVSVPAAMVTLRIPLGRKPKSERADDPQAK
ncbi:MAG: hypothetical protein J7500_02295 [Sphingomonas sp.]|uniref:hypothetical protein n=1 Tax=Sphingomonas sp. TaxID=28214 RepID=UPI001B02CC04|nr:hypothetical protein [Sphingomonas sp.]MBO9621522.1 hypothetical protein [Sphingomonas sp.]